MGEGGALSLFRFHLSPFAQKRLIFTLGLWASSNKDFLKTKQNVIISRYYGICEIIRAATFGERLHNPFFRNKRFGELSRFLENLFFFNSHSTIRTNVDIYFVNAIQPLAQMTTWLYDVGITMSCKTTFNIPSYYSYLKLPKLYVVLLEILTPSSHSHAVM